MKTWERPIPIEKRYLPENLENNSEMSTKLQLQIAIDGPAGSGKSTVARIVAERLNIAYIDTGAMYRAITLKLLRQGCELSRRGRVEELLKETELKLLPGGHILLDGEDVTAQIRTPEVNAMVSKVAELTSVRHNMVQQQKEIAAKSEGVVMEGRDIASTVMPQAPFKFYLDASLPVRARRRLQEQQEKGMPLTYENTFHEIKERDRIDSQRTHSPLSVTPGTKVIDTTSLTIEEVVENILEGINRRRD